MQFLNAFYVLIESESLFNLFIFSTTIKNRTGTHATIQSATRYLVQ